MLYHFMNQSNIHQLILFDFGVILVTKHFYVVVSTKVKVKSMPYDSTTSSAGAGLILFFVIFYIAIIAFFIYVWWRIFAKAGYSGARSLLLLVPIANIIIIIMFAFSEWPIQRELNQLRQMARSGSGQYPPQFAQQYPPPQQFPSSPQYPPQQYPPQQPQYPQM